ncbi:MAG: 1-acyl-sn-glycerol-3-phosphate acyltransferase [Actinomycetota bacterium]|nr:1-acyl-sn-glycerol-3-phosphate acyltransferase [Actinomycetota bacterium]
MPESSVPVAHVGGPPGRAGLIWYGFARAVVEAVCRVVWRVEISGADNIPKSGGYVLAPVHRSIIDTFLCGCLTRRRLRFIGKDSVWKYAWSARFVTSLGGIPVHRGMPDREALRACEAAIRAGEPAVLYPEGTRQKGPVVHPLFEGAAFVAARTGVPIIPVGIGGSEWALPKGSKMVKAVKIHMIVGAPIAPPARTESGARVSRRAVKETTDTLYTQVQQLFDGAMARAGRTGQVAPD